MGGAQTTPPWLGALAPIVRLLASAGLTIEFSGTSGAQYLQLGDGAAAAVGAANTVRFRLNAATSSVQVSINGAAYVDIATGASPWTESGGVISMTTDTNVVRIDHENALNNDAIPLILEHENSAGAGANNIGVGISFRAENDGSAMVDLATLIARLTSAAAGAESSGIAGAVRDGGAAITQRLFLTPAGALVVGTASITTGANLLRVMGAGIVEGAFEATGNFLINGTIVLTSGRLVAIDWLPNAADSFDLGASAASRWRNAFIRNATLNESNGPFTTPATFGVSQDNFSTANTSALRLAATAAGLNVTGFANPTDGKELDIINVGANAFTLPHNNAGSLAANRLDNAGSAGITLNAAGGTTVGGRVRYKYDAGADSGVGRWVQWSPVVQP